MLDGLDVHLGSSTQNVGREMYQSKGKTLTAVWCTCYWGQASWSTRRGTGRGGNDRSPSCDRDESSPDRQSQEDSPRPEFGGGIENFVNDLRLVPVGFVHPPRA